MKIKSLLIIALAMLAVASGSFAQKKQLTIINRSDIPLRVYVDSSDWGTTINSIGFVDPGERITFGYPLRLGRWYAKIRAYAPYSSFKILKFTLYVKQDKHQYSYEIRNSDFSNSPIPAAPNVSIIGKWATKSGVVTEFRRVGDEYIGTLVSFPDSRENRLLTNFGYEPGMEWIKVKRTDFDLYKGFKIRLDRQGNKTEVRWECEVNDKLKWSWYYWIRQ